LSGQNTVTHTGILAVEDSKMSISSIIVEIDKELALLNAARKLLAEAPTAKNKRGPGRPPKATTLVSGVVAKKPHKRLSAAARARIAAAQKARWAKQKQAKAVK
jgi:hypothetical protein